MQVALQFLERVVDGVGGDTLLPTFLLALLGREVALARIVCCVNVIAAAEAFDLFAGASSSRLDMPTGFVGADEVTFALRTDPLAGDGVVFKEFKVGLCRHCFDLDKGEVKAVCRAALSVSDEGEFLRSVGVYLRGDNGGEETSPDGTRSAGDGL